MMMKYIQMLRNTLKNNNMPEVVRMLTSIDQRYNECRRQSSYYRYNHYLRSYSVDHHHHHHDSTTNNNTVPKDSMPSISNEKLNSAVSVGKHHPHDEASQAVLDYLIISRGYSIEVAEGMVKAIRSFNSSELSVEKVKSFANSTLKALSESVQREILLSNQQLQRETISIKINIPRERRHFYIHDAIVGTSFYDLCQTNKELAAYLECACNGIAACSTCHVIIHPQYYSQLPLPEESELDMLDLAKGPTTTSRLGCQMRFTADLDGLEVDIPDEANNLY
jgi:2Fe-2S ferredoxin